MLTKACDSRIIGLMLTPVGSESDVNYRNVEYDFPRDFRIVGKV